ncbi:MAG TPA: feruloyl-CoA synthase [Steroidobacteraceae bacterium]|jgi:feruloyl-CoA synthase|nr:feruloyl-CoA synthase [Steroidobacteraceae bacterium]
MGADPLAWAPSSFAVEVERRTDGALILTPRTPLADYPRRVTDALEHWARLAPERLLLAQRAADGQWRRLSYGQTLRQVRALAAGLASFELSAQRPLLILSGNGIEHLLLALAAMYLGVPYCPVSAAYSQAGSDLAKLRYVMQLLTPGMIAALDTAADTTAAFARALEATAPADAVLVGAAPLAPGRAVLALEQLASEDPTRAEAAHALVQPDSIAKFLLTSGSTGQPKAVITTHRMLCSNQVMLRAAVPFVLEQPPILVDWLPWNHTFGGSHNVGLALFNGGSLYIDDGRPVPGAFERTVRNLREISPTIHLDVPKGYEMLARRMEQDTALRDSFYRRLRACFFAAAGLPQHIWDALDRHALATQGRRVPILSGLGATETAPAVTFTTPANERAGVIGLPAPGSIVKLAAVGDKWELRSRGPHVTPGYWRAAEQTAAAFDEEGFYCMGDAVRLIDPADPARGLVFDGRLTEDFKLSSGSRVSVGPLRLSLLRVLAPLALDLVIAGPDRDEVAILVLPDLEAACAAIGAGTAPLPQAELARDPRLLRLLAERLEQHARAQLGSTTRVQRAAVLSAPPSLDRGEITDKGSLNQRLMLQRWAQLVEQLYHKVPPAHVISVQELAQQA